MVFTYGNFQNWFDRFSACNSACRIARIFIELLYLYRNSQFCLLASCTCYTIRIITPCPQSTVLLKGNCKVLSKLNLRICYIICYNYSAEYCLVCYSIYCNSSCLTLSYSRYVSYCRIRFIKCNLSNRVVKSLPFK